ncbi:MAG: feruloyl-CoA synthase [Burkholderiales bacterium]|nr:feruloyl-CoA synthase [Burkholderiales bacterium]
MSAAADPARPVRAVRLGPTRVEVERRADGALLLRSAHPLEPYPGRLTERLEFWAARAPRRVFLAQRDAAGAWRTLSYAAALAQARRIGSALIARGLSAERPVAVLSGNDLEHALIELGALLVGVPYAPISPAYSLLSEDFLRLRQVLALLTPGMVYAADGSAFARAIAAAVPADAELVLGRGEAARGATPFAALLEREDTAAVDAAHARVGPETIAKFLFTSGSTDLPKAVINTQRMWCANQAMIRSVLAYFRDEPPVVVDWAPWHHTAAGNHDFGLVLYNGGSYYIDEGKPMPGAIEATVRNLREIAPTFYFNVPKGFEALLPHLHADAALRRNFFSRLKVLWFAGAGLAQHVFDEMKDLAYRSCGETILFLTGLGSTETAPLTLARVWDTADAANMGLPPPGAELKLVPFEGKYEMRVKGPHVTPGYWRQPALTAQAFDAKGWYRLGDAFSLADPRDPARGLRFEGRVAEDFKLATGTWVHVGALRARCIAQLAPLARDVVIAGHDRDYVAALIVPDPQASAGRDDAALRAELAGRLRALAAANPGSSMRIERALVLREAPSLDAGEMTDKGSINQRAVLARRAALVDALYADPPAADVIRAGD